MSLSLCLLVVECKRGDRSQCRHFNQQARQNIPAWVAVMPEYR